ncbi:mitotic spindle assembly checkpoint protein MAD2B [Entomortierella parvispora]|uniref:Mitotic spindle assembly checkpoint protein MAD2B n=1 Tax=Entomortierella parvispora TaxID=205924 RepID=A0A9P3H8X3_9FUNG|nr:mitotic spindle assembly checkpoint protein MAD2B [Entomortierella parvispora]
MNPSGPRAVVADVLSEFLEVAIHLILFVRGIYTPELFESTQKYGCPLKTARHPGLTAYIQQIVKSIRTELIKDTIHRIGVVTLNSEGKGIDRYVFEMSMFQSFEEGLIPSLELDAGNDLNRKGTGKGKGRAIDQDVDMDGMRGIDGNVQDRGSGNNDGDELLQQRSKAYRIRLLEQERQRRVQIAEDRPRFSGLMTLTTDVEALFRSILLKISVSRPDLPSSDSDNLSFTVVVETKSEGPGPEAKPDFPWSPISATVPNEQTKISVQPEAPSTHRKIIPIKTVDIAGVQLELYIESL